MNSGGCSVRQSSARTPFEDFAFFLESAFDLTVLNLPILNALFEQLDLTFGSINILNQNG